MRSAPSRYVICYWLLVVYGCLLAGCARKITERSLPFCDIVPKKDRHTLTTGSSQSDSLQILYLGCGHLVMLYKDEAVVVDPYFSIQPFTPGKKIKSHVKDYQQWKQAIQRHQVDLSKTTSIWLAHTHYDHTMDLPMMIENKHFTDSVRVFGSEDGPRTFTNFPKIKSQYNTVSKSQVYIPDSPTVPNQIKTGKHIEVLPIQSDHAPHAKFLGITFHLMKGNVREKYFQKHYDSSTDRTKKKQWREGATYSFLIDFKTGDHIDYRVFVQTSGSHFPKGKPPEALLKQKPVDVALLCLASSNYAKPYPVQIIEYLDRFAPTKFMFIHWEDFFSRGSFGHYKLVRLTNFRKIHKRLKRANITLNSTDDLMPQPGTNVVVK